MPRRSQKKPRDDRESSMPGSRRSREGSRSWAKGSDDMPKYESMSENWPAMSGDPKGIGVTLGGAEGYLELVPK
mgnify:FL=1